MSGEDKRHSAEIVVVSGRNGLEDLAAASWEPPPRDIVRLGAEVKRLRWAVNRYTHALTAGARLRTAAMGAKANQLIDENPVPTLLGVFAVGFLLGLFMRPQAQPVKRTRLPQPARRSV